MTNTTSTATTTATPGTQASIVGKLSSASGTISQTIQPHTNDKSSNNDESIPMPSSTVNDEVFRGGSSSNNNSINRNITPPDIPNTNTTKPVIPTTESDIIIKSESELASVTSVNKVTPTITPRTGMILITTSHALFGTEMLRSELNV